MNFNLFKLVALCAIGISLSNALYSQADCVNDTIPPVALCETSISVTLDDGVAIIDESMVDIGSTDDCAIQSISLSKYEYDCSDVSFDLSQFISFSNSNIPAEVFGKNGFLGFSGDNGYATLKSGFNTDMVEFYTEEILDQNPSVYCVEIKAKGFNDILSMQYALEFDTEYLSYNGSNNVGLSQFTDQNLGLSGSTLGISWVSSNVIDGETVADESTLFSICFDVVNQNESSTVLIVSDEAGNTSACITMVDVLDTESPVLDCSTVTAAISEAGSVNLDYDMVISNLVDDCSISSYHFDQAVYDCDDFYIKEKVAPYFVNAPLSPEMINVSGVNDFKGISYYNTLSVSNGDTGEETSLNIEESFLSDIGVCYTIEATNFDSITGVQFSLAFDPSVLKLQTFEGVLSQFNQSNYSVPAPGLISVSWNSIDPETGVTISDNGLLFDICFELKADMSNENKLTVSDASGNSSSCSFEVVVDDQISPTIELNNVVLELDANGNISLDNMSFVDIISDNCGVALVDFPEEVELSCAEIAVVPNVSISLSNTPALMEFIDNESQFLNLVDILSGDTLVQVDSDKTLGINILQSNGNEAYEVCYDFLVQGFEDLIGFQFSVDFDEDILSYNGLGSSDLPYFSDININQVPSGELVVSWTSLDIENGVSVPAGFNIFSVCFDYLGSIGVPVEVEAMDYYGNTTTGTAFAVVVDGVGPEMICEDYTTLYLDEDGLVIFNSGDMVISAEDNCSVANVQSEQLIYSCDDLGVFTLPVFSSDSYGNTSFCEVSIEVKDIITPQIDCQPIVLSNLENGVAYLDAEDAVNVIFDNCEAYDISLSIDEFDCSTVLQNQISLVNEINTNVPVEFANVNEEIMSTSITINGETYSFGNGTPQVELNVIPSGVISAQQIYCYDIIVDGFTDVISFQFGLEFDNETSQLVSALAVDLEDDSNFIPTATGGDLGILWYATDLLSGVSLDNGATLATICYETEEEFQETTVAVTVTDGSGNSSVCETTVSVNDQTAPIASCNNLEISLSENTDNYLDVALFDGGSSDDCCLSELSVVRNNPLCDNSFEFSDAVLFCEEDLGQEVVVLLKATDCSGNSSICEAFVTVEDVFSSTNKVSVKTEMHVYPNPVAEKLFVELNHSYVDGAMLRIISIDGKILDNESIELIPGNNSFEMNTDNLKSGVYYLEIISSSGIWTKKITKI